MMGPKTERPRARSRRRQRQSWHIHSFIHMPRHRSMSLVWFSVVLCRSLYTLWWWLSPSPSPSVVRFTLYAGFIDKTRCSRRFLFVSDFFFLYSEYPALHFLYKSGRSLSRVGLGLSSFVSCRYHMTVMAQ